MGKVVLVTGASSGIGLAVSEYLAQKGFTVYGGSRSAPESKIFRSVSLDVTDTSDVNRAVKEIITSEGRIDVLLNNAGVGSFGAIEKTPIEDIKKSFEVNTYGVVRLCQAVMPHMRKNKDGLIINISTLGSAIGLPYRAFYSASKAAMTLITESLRLEAEGYGIRACTIHPGEVRTNIGQHRIISTAIDDETYGKVITKAYKALDASVEHGLDPAYFGPFIEKIILSKRVKRSYQVGTFSEKLGVKLKTILPYYLYEKILRLYFKSED